MAARENAASGQAMGALPDFVKAIALNNKLDESRDFATYVQRSMIEKLRVTNKTVKDLGVKQAPFVVLIGAAMPSVLAEISFVTNPQEAKLLKSSAYRQRIADALFAAIRKVSGVAQARVDRGSLGAAGSGRAKSETDAAASRAPAGRHYRPAPVSPSAPSSTSARPRSDPFVGEIRTMIGAAERRNLRTIPRW